MNCSICGQPIATPTLVVRCVACINRISVEEARQFQRASLERVRHDKGMLRVVTDKGRARHVLLYDLRATFCGRVLSAGQADRAERAPFYGWEQKRGCPICAEKIAEALACSA